MQQGTIANHTAAAPQADEVWSVHVEPMLKGLLANRRNAAATLIAVTYRDHEGTEAGCHWEDVEPPWPGPAVGLARVVAHLLSILASEARLELLWQLWDGDKTVPELVNNTGRSQGTLHHHLHELYAFRWVERLSGNRFTLTHAGRLALACAWAVANRLPVPAPAWPG